MPAGDSNNDSDSWFELLVIATLVRLGMVFLCEVMIMSTTIKSPEELTIFAQVDRNWLKHAKTPIWVGVPENMVFQHLMVWNRCFS